jgi:hypothetical protein
LTIGDHVIANVITKCFDGIKEIIKLKCWMKKKVHIIDSRKQPKEIVLWGQLQMAKLFTKVLKAKRLSWHFTLFCSN